MLKTVSSVINAIGALNYQGTWDASTNTPTLTSGVGTKGDYYVVSVAGSTNLDGTTLWGVGDWAVFNGSIWQKVDGGSTGDFTNVSISGTLTLSGGTANAVTYLNTSKVVTTGTALQFDGATLGVGVTPQTWWATRKALQVGTLGAMASDSSTVAFTANIYNNSGGTATYLTTKAASAYYQTGGQHLWYSAASGTAGDPITLTQRMGLDASGNLTLNAGTANGVAYLDGSKVLTTGTALTFDGTNLGVGTTSPTTKLEVNGPAKITGSSLQVAPSTGTNTAYVSATNTGGTFYVGIDTSTGSAFGAGAYGRVLYSSGAYPMVFFTNDTERMRLDSSGNLGLGVTPSAWGGSFKAFQIVSGGTSLWSDGSVAFYNRNTFYDGTNRKYVVSGYAQEYAQLNDGSHAWKITSSGTAGDPITFTQAMTLDASGNLGVGVTSIQRRLHLGGGTNDVGIKLSTDTSGNGNLDGADITFATSNTLFITNRENGATVFETNGAERARIDSSGNLLVGTSTVYGKISLVANANSNNDVWVRNDSSGSSSACGVVLNASGNSWRMGMGSTANNSNALTWIVDVSGANSEKMRLDTSGNLLVGKTSTSVSVSGALLLNTGAVGSSIATGNDTFFVYNTTAAAYRFYVTDAGTVFATNTTISAISDQRFKENIRELDVGLNAIMSLKPRKFDWKTGKGKDIKGDRGFIAQEFEQVFPDLIDEWKEPAPEGEEPYKSVRQDLIPVLVKAIQEQQAIIEQLEIRVAQLEGV